MTFGDAPLPPGVTAAEVLSVLPDTVLLLDPDGVITGFAASNGATFGWNLDELVGTSVFDFFAKVANHDLHVDALARAGFFTGASARNWAGYGHDVDLGAGLGDVERALLTDPQTSGGLLVACDPAHVEDVLEVFHREGFEHATEIGEIVAGAPRVGVA